MFEQVPGGSLLSVMEFGFLGMDSLTSQNQFLLGLGINSDNHNSLIHIMIYTLLPLIPLKKQGGDILLFFVPMIMNESNK